MAVFTALVEYVPSASGTPTKIHRCDAAEDVDVDISPLCAAAKWDCCSGKSRPVGPEKKVVFMRVTQGECLELATVQAI